MEEVMKTVVYVWKCPKDKAQGEYEYMIECIGPIDVEEAFNWARSNNYTVSINPHLFNPND